MCMLRLISEVILLYYRCKIMYRYNKLPCHLSPPRIWPGACEEETGEGGVRQAKAATPQPPVLHLHQHHHRFALKT